MNREKRRWALIMALIFFLASVSAWVALPEHPRLKIGQIERNLDFKLGLDLRGGAQLVYRANVAGVAPTDVEEEMAGVRDVIEKRVNAFGVSEPVVQVSRVSGEERVIVELAGVHDTNEAIKLIGETPQLDFRREVSPEEALAQFNIDNPESIEGPIFERTELTGKHLQRASVAFDPVVGQPQVNLEFDDTGAELFSQLTEQNLGHRIAIYLDGVPISAPVVQAQITNGQAVISGGFTLEEAKQLSQRLNAGALPIPIELIGQTQVGPSLGQRSIDASLKGGLVGLAAVAVWMIIYYRLPGVVACVALGLYVIFFLALIKLIPVTLTLAGVAGIILSVGMAVDANVLIFERWREDLRSGKSVDYALRDGFRWAWGSIKAGNVSSLITAVILYALGTSIIRGFALTFGLGILLSMFTAVTITRVMLLILMTWQWARHPLLLGVRQEN